MQKGMLTLLALATALSMSLWGCGSNRDSDSSNVSPTVDIESAARVGNCTICHTLDVHTFDSRIAGQNPDLQGLGSAIEHNCESCHGGGQYHHGEGPIPFPSPTAERCGVCHEGTENVPASAHAAMSCSGCHNSLQKEISTFTDEFGDHVICAQCHDGEAPAEEPFAGDIYTRFKTSRHANQHARTAFCSACHSHEGGVLLLSQQRFTDIEDLVEFYNSENVPFYNLPEAAEAADGVGVNVKTCATCHDQHATTLRGDGDIVETVTWEGVEEEATVYSAEFNLCTACHMVDLVATPAGHGDAGVLFEYTLSDKYLKENLVDAQTDTWKEVDIEGRGLTKVSNVFYHDGTSANNRHFVDTHFGGKLYSSLYNIGAADTEFVDMDVKGYNINAANPNACTVCHDPHTGGKMLSPAEPENNDNAAIGYAEGLGDFHTNHLGDAQGHGCTPCHSGDSFVPMTTMGTAASAPKTSVIGCRSCHDLAVPNTTPNTNDAAAFALVREFQSDYEFKFESDAVVDVADLGVNQICFECHKGRSGVKEDAGTTTQVYGVSYLHYAPSMAILFGDESKMVPTYEGKTYAGKFVHPNNGTLGDDTPTPFGCVDCHDVHNTDGNDVVKNKMINPEFDCSDCHTEAGAANLKARTVDYGTRLHDTIIAEYNERFEPDITAEDFHGIISGRGAATEIGDNDLAYAASIYKIFNYEDGSPTGTEHGHGGSWAHNSVFARQVQYDAIEALKGDLTGLVRPE